MFLNVVALIILPGMVGVLISNIIFALGYDIKTLGETNLLYDSVSTRGGEGLYTKLDTLGGSWYCYLDGILCLVAGYLFVINNYIPVCICGICALVSTIMAFGFKDVHKIKIENHKNFLTTIKEYGRDLKTSSKFIMKSRRMRAYILFGSIFYAIIRINATYRSDLLLAQGVSEQEFSTIFAIITLISGALTSQTKRLHNKFKNKTLTVLSLFYVIACLIASVSAILFTNEIAIPIIIGCCAIFKISDSFWYLLEYKYLKNFTTEKVRNKIMFTYEAITCMIASIISLFGSILLDITNINNAFLIVSLISIIAIVLVLDYMRTRIGLRPSQYEKEDIEFE